MERLAQAPTRSHANADELPVQHTRTLFQNDESYAKFRSFDEQHHVETRRNGEPDPCPLAEEQARMGKASQGCDAEPERTCRRSGVGGVDVTWPDFPVGAGSWREESS